MRSIRQLLRRSSVVAVFLFLAILGLVTVSYEWFQAQQSRAPFETIVYSLANDSSPEVRAMAARSLGKIGDKRAIDPLLQAYQDDPVIRRNVTLALKELGVSATELTTRADESSPWIVIELEKLTKSFDLKAFVIAYLLWLVGLVIFVFIVNRVLLVMFNIALSRRVTFSLWIVIAIAISSVIFWLRYAPESINPNRLKPEIAEMAMVELSGVSKDGGAVPNLVGILSNSRKPASVRAKAAESLGMIGDSRAVDTLISVARSDPSDSYTKDVRIFAIWALGNIKSSKQESSFSYYQYLIGAISEYDSILALDPSNSYSYLGRGIAFITIGNYSEALANLDKAVLYNPSTAQGFYYRGIAHILKGESDKAFLDLTRAITLDPSLPDSYCRRGELYKSSGEIDKALNDLLTCTHLDSRRVEVHLSLGLIYRQRNQFPEAKGEFEKYLADEPHAPDAATVKKWIEELSSQ